MKKFLITLFFLVIIAGVCFYFGWAQMGIPPDSCGVLISKSHGIYPQLIKPGEINWIWYRLIPTNTKMLVFRITPVHHEFYAKNILPSGKVYSLFAGMECDFSWEINAEISFKIKPDTLMELVKDNIISSQNDLAGYEIDTARRIETIILRIFDMGADYSDQIGELLEAGESPVIRNEIQNNFPQLENISINIKSSKLPDFSLYRQIKNLYGDYILRQKEFLTADLNGKARNRSGILDRLDELELYGSLLNKYPLLLEYLKIENSK